MKLSAASILVNALAALHQPLSVKALPSYAVGLNGTSSDYDNIEVDSSDSFSWGSLTWSKMNCNLMRLGLAGARLNSVSCPAMRFLTREGLINSLFDKCSFHGNDVYAMEASSIKSMIGEGKGNYPGLRLDIVMTKKDGNELSGSVLSRVMGPVIDGQVTEVGGIDYLNVDQLEMHLDHSASSGIIGSATNEFHGEDNEAVNWDKYYEFLNQMCECSSPFPALLWQLGPFSAKDVGKAVNHFGKKIEDAATRESTKIGAFSWGILAFEWANNFLAFNKNGVLPYKNFFALFFPFGTFGPNLLERDPLSSPTWIGYTICDMNIRISSVVKQAMDDALEEHGDCSAAIDGSGSKAETQCKAHALLTDICGDGYRNCLEDTANNMCPGSPCSSNSQCESGWCLLNKCTRMPKPSMKDLPYCFNDSLLASKRFLDVVSNDAGNVAGMCLLKEDDIPDKCLDEEFDLALYAVEGPHFMLGASNKLNRNCPDVALVSTEGSKQKIMLPKDTEGISSHHFGKVTLGDLLEAEEMAPPTDEKGFDLVSNTCLHYGQRIWRSLGFFESDDLAKFVVEHVSNDPNFDDMAKDRMGGMRYLAAKAVGGKSAMVSYLEDIVYSQSIINY